MKFGVALFPLRPQQIIEVTLAAEELGFDSVWLGEHVVTPVASESRFPYAGEKDDGHEAFHANLPFYDPYAVLGYLAAVTRRLKLAVSVSIVPLHDPFRLARSVATLDLLSNGRFLFGMGGGWLKEEFEILGRDWETRGTRFNETLDVMESLFNDEVTQYAGRVLQVPPVGMIPKAADAAASALHLRWACAGGACLCRTPRRRLARLRALARGDGGRDRDTRAAAEWMRSWRCAVRGELQRHGRGRRGRRAALRRCRCAPPRGGWGAGL